MALNHIQYIASAFLINLFVQPICINYANYRRILTKSTSIKIVETIEIKVNLNKVIHFQICVYQS